MQKNQIHKMINELIHRGHDSKNKLQFVKHYNDFSISPELVEEIIKESNFMFFAHEFSMDAMQSAYEPFFDWIKELIDCIMFSELLFCELTFALLERSLPHYERKQTAILHCYAHS